MVHVPSNSMKEYLKENADLSNIYEQQIQEQTPGSSSLTMKDLENYEQKVMKPGDEEELMRLSQPTSWCTKLHNMAYVYINGPSSGKGPMYTMTIYTKDGKAVAAKLTELSSGHASVWDTHNQHIADFQTK